MSCLYLSYRLGKLGSPQRLKGSGRKGMVSPGRGQAGDDNSIDVSAHPPLPSTVPHGTHLGVLKEATPNPLLVLLKYQETLF